MVRQSSITRKWVVMGRRYAVGTLDLRKSLLDMRKAFDLVDTDVLLKKLVAYQCDEHSVAWFKS